MSDVQTRFDLALVRHVNEYYYDKKAFFAKVERFDPNAMNAYVALMLHWTAQQQSDVPPDLLELNAPNHFFRTLNESTKLLQSEKQLSNYLVDAFEVMATATKCMDDERFYGNCHSFLRIALQNEQTDIISVYLQILHRLDRVFEKKEIPVEIFESIIHFVHGPFNDTKLLNQALLLTESNILKRHNLDHKTPASEQLLRFIWKKLCSSQRAKHQCDTCYTIVSQLIDRFLYECKVNESFRMEFLSRELWQFIRAAIESKELVRRKQAIYILQNVLLSNEEVVMSTSGEFHGESNADLANIWKNYFTVLESLLEIQCQLIISCLDQYLVGIVENLPPFWYSIIFALVLEHHNNDVTHYGIEFVLKHGISFAHDSDLMDKFYNAMNNTYLHAEAKISEQDLAKYFCESDMNHTLTTMWSINWLPVPLWTVIKSLETYVKSTQGGGFQISLLLNFLKRSVSAIKALPQIDEMLLSILKNIPYTSDLTLEQTLGLYEVMPRTEVLHIFQQPLDLQKFEFNFIQLHQVSIEAKISYFRHAIPDINERIELLDKFYEKYRNTVEYKFPHYEYLVFDSLCQSQPFSKAFLEIKSRLYHLMKPRDKITLDGLIFVSTLLKFIVVNFALDNSDFATYDSINKILNNIYNVIKKKLYDDSCNAMKIQEIRNNLTSINMRLTKCEELYPIKMAVLGVLADAMMIEDETIDLSRFSHTDERDVKLIQGLYDCFIDKSHEFKQSHQANVISIILSNFPQLELDLWKAYRILLNGKADVACIFKQTDPYCISKVNGILVDALLYGNELKGDEKQVYDFVASKSSSSTYNQRVRLAAMRAIAEKNDVDQIRALKDQLFVENMEKYRLRYYTNSFHHSVKMRITQALAFLFRLDPKWDDRMLQIILREANQTNVTHINELIVAETIEPSQMLHIIENIDGNKGMQSMFVIIYYVCCKNPTNVQLARDAVELLLNYVLVKQIVVRTFAQITLLKLCEKFDLIDEFKCIYKSTKFAHETQCSRALKFSYAYRYRFEQIDPNQVLHTMYTLREIPRITKMCTDENYKHEIYDQGGTNLVIHVEDDDFFTSPESMDVELAFIENTDDTVVKSNISTSGNGNTAAGGNVQRKLVTYRETFIDRQILNSLPDEFTLRASKNTSDLIILGSLLTKATNLGGISRSSEVFGVKAVALDNLKFLKHNDFTSISMASEKWLKFFEVKTFNVINYLMAMKAYGYAIVGAEQTAYGRELHKTQLPKRMVLVLGHEKDGIPANILNLLDMAIEIPQFGVVRSLNVHVTASLFMWEYCKQHLIIDSANSP